MRPCVVSTTTLLCLVDRKAMIGPVQCFFTTKYSAKVLSPISNINVTVAYSFSKWTFATYYWLFVGLTFLKITAGAGCLILCIFIWAIAMTRAPESTWASFAKPFLKSGGTDMVSLFRFSTLVDGSRRYKSLVCLPLTNLFSTCGVLMVRKALCRFHLD